MSALMWLKEFYWVHRTPILGSAGALAIALLQLVLVLWMLRQLRELGHLRERLSRLADGLALLTDTTEAGLSTLLREMQHLTRRANSRPRSRATVTQRVNAAVRSGNDVATIASNESMSESEVLLHMKLADPRIARTAAQ